MAQYPYPFEPLNSPNPPQPSSPQGPDTSFIDKLRMNSIFPTGDTPFGMPNLNSGGGGGGINLNSILRMISLDKQRQREHEMNLARQNRISSGQINPLTGKPIQQIGQSMQQQPNVQYIPGMADEYAQSIVRGTTPAGKDTGKATTAPQPTKLEILQPKGGNIMTFNPVTGETKDTGVKSGTMTEQEEKQLAGEEARKTEGVKGETTLKKEAAETKAAAEKEKNKAWTVYNIQDPNDPTGKKTIPVQYNPITQEGTPLKIGGKDIGPVTKPGTKLASVQPVNLEGIQDKARETLAEIDNLLDPSGKLKPDAAQVVGGSRMLPYHWIPGSKSATADATIKRVKAQQIVGLIGEMKSQSQTGATGFGQLNLRELGVLESAASKLDTNISDEEFERELVRIKEKLNKIIQPPPGETETKTTLTPAQLIEQYRTRGR